MLTLPLHPRLARFMVESARRGIQDDAAIAAAILTERDPFRDHASQRSTGATSATGCDISERIRKLRGFEAGDDSAVHNVSAAKQVLRVAKQLRRSAKDSSSAASSSDPTDQTNHGGQPEANALKRALLAAYPDRVAKRRSDACDRGVMVGGRGVRLDALSLARREQLFLCINVDAGGTEAKVRIATDIKDEWLDPHLIREVDEPFYSATHKAVVARRRRYFVDLLLTESPIQCVPNPEVAETLAHHARLNLVSVFPAKEREIQSFIDRVRFVNAQMPELELPALDDDTIDTVLVSLCQSRTSFAELQSAPWLDHLRGRYDYAQMQLVDKHAPTRMTVPSGNSIAVRYAKDKPPIMEVRIQEVFGWKETPRVAGGKVAVQLHLLGPNYRPQQVTEDLANFWKETYSHVRKELRRRYSKHHWPEDPIAAKATRNGLQPRS